MKILKFLFAIICTTFFTSCATIFCKPQTITVASDIDGADVYVGRKLKGQTPLSFDTKNSKMTITVKKEGFEDQMILTDRKINHVVWLDCLAGGIPGLVDLCSNRYWRYRQTDYFVSLTDPSINDAHNEKVNKRWEPVAKAAAVIGSVAMAGLATYASVAQAEHAQKAAEREAREAQQRAELEAKIQANHQRSVQAQREREQQEIDRRNAAMANNPIPTGSTTTNRTMETSDLAQYNAIRMSDAVHGTEATNQALAQQKTYDAEQRQQAYINNQREFEQQLGVTENAVTSSGVRVQIKVNNGVVTAYSTSQNNFSGTGPEWKKVNVAIARSGDTRYGYQADILPLGRIFWGEHPNTSPTEMRGTAINAVTANGETIQIRVQDEMVIAFRTNGNLPWTNRMVSAKKTNVTYDGEQIAARFKYKAEIPEIGTIYF